MNISLLLPNSDEPRLPAGRIVANLGNAADGDVRLLCHTDSARPKEAAV